MTSSLNWPVVLEAWYRTSDGELQDYCMEHRETLTFVYTRELRRCAEECLYPSHADIAKLLGSWILDKHEAGSMHCSGRGLAQCGGVVHMHSGNYASDTLEEDTTYRHHTHYGGTGDISGAPGKMDVPSFHLRMDKRKYGRAVGLDVRSDSRGNACVWREDFHHLLLHTSLHSSRHLT